MSLTRHPRMGNGMDRWSFSSVESDYCTIKFKCSIVIKSVLHFIHTMLCTEIALWKYRLGYLRIIFQFLVDSKQYSGMKLEIVRTVRFVSESLLSVFDDLMKHTIDYTTLISWYGKQVSLFDSSQSRISFLFIPKYNHSSLGLKQSKYMSL